MFRAPFWVVLALYGWLIPAVWAEHIITDGDYRISVKVVPRIGAFWTSAFQEEWDSDCKLQRVPGLLTWTDYSSALNASLAPLAYVLPDSSPGIKPTLSLPAWDIVTTRHATGRKDCGYKARRVLISVTAKGGLVPPGCVVAFGKGLLADQPSIGTCTAYVNLFSNRETPFTVEVLDATGAKRLLNGAVPEDVLIASLGDSFASGEGNPDVPKGIRGEALWMDARCHRSVYSGHLRAAVRILKEQAGVSNAHYQRSLAAGAMTVVSFACSGALVSQGLNGPYVGVVPYEKALQAYPSTAETAARARRFGGISPIESQILQLRTFLSNQGPHAKQTVDLMVLSGGGNDVEFGALVTGMVTRNIAHSTLQDSIDDSLDDHFAQLTASFGDFKTAINSFAVTHPVSQTIVVKYPDPLYRMKGVNCSGTMEAGTADLGLLVLVRNLLNSFGQLRLDDDEVDYVRRRVITPLNVLLDKQAVKSDDGWQALDMMVAGTADVRRHGWCLTGAGDAYEEQGRWFRSVVDSLRFQGNINGSFHPTLEFTDKIQGVLIAQTFTDAINAEPKWESVSVTPSRRQDDVLIVPARPAIRYSLAGTLRPILTSSSWPTMKCQPDALRCDGMPDGFVVGTHGASVAIDGSAVSESTPRVYRRNGFLRLRVDARPPTISCLVAGTSTAVPCTGLGWLKSQELKIIVEDTDSGVASATVSVLGSLGPTMPTAFNRRSDTVMEIPVHLPTDGEFALTVCAADGVGNMTGTPGACDVSFVIRADTTVPRLSSVVAHQVDWSNGAQVPIPTIPVFGDQPPNTNFSFQPKSALIVCYPSCQFQPAVEADTWRRNVNEMKAVDAAGNETVIPYATLRLPDFNESTPRRTAMQWKAKTAADTLALALRAALSIEPRLKRLIDVDKPGTAGAMTTLEDNNASAAQQAQAALWIFNSMREPGLVVDWLNLLSGATYRGNKVVLKNASACVIGSGIPAGGLLQIQLLHRKAQCAAGADLRLVDK